MYGLSKIHKKDIFLRPILLMTGSAQHQLAQWFTSVINSVLLLFSPTVFPILLFSLTKSNPLTFLHLSCSAPMTSAAFY